MKYCAHCGNQLLDQAVVCPKCGCATEYYTSDEITPGYNVLSIVGFVVSIVSVIFAYFGLLGSITGLALSIAALVQINRRGERGKGFAIAGICVGAIFSAIWILLWCFLLLGLIIAIGMSGA